MVTKPEKTTFDKEFFLSLSVKDQFELLKELVQKGEFETVPTDILTVENTTLDETPKKTVLHMLAQLSHLRENIPPHLLTEKTLKIRLKDVTNGVGWYGKRLVDTLARHRAIGIIPKESLTQDLLESKNEEGESLLHFLAMTKQFKEVPKERLSTNNLHLKNNAGHTVLEYIAENQITHIPGNLLLEEDLKRKTNSGDSVLQAYIRRDKIHEINEEFLNKETLLLENPSKVSSLMTLVAYGYYEYIPKELLREENILKENQDGENCMDIAFKTLVQTNKKEDQGHYLETCLKLLKQLPQSYVNTLEDRLNKKYNPSWKEAWNLLQRIIKTEKQRRGKETVDKWLETKKDQYISI